MTTLELRNAQPSDAGPIRDCILSAYAEAMRDIADLPDVGSGIEDAIGTYQVVIAEEGGQLCGVIMFNEQRDAMMILNLAVTREAQGKGVARKLLDTVEARAADAGLSTLRLRTHRLMYATRAMYTHLGWTEVEISGNSVLMQKLVA